MKKRDRLAQLFLFLELFIKSEFVYLCLTADDISEEFLEFIQKELTDQGYSLSGSAFDTPLTYPPEEAHIYKQRRIKWIQSMIQKYSV